MQKPGQDALLQFNRLGGKGGGGSLGLASLGPPPSAATRPKTNSDGFLDLGDLWDFWTLGIVGFSMLLQITLGIVSQVLDKSGCLQFGCLLRHGRFVLKSDGAVDQHY